MGVEPLLEVGMVRLLLRPSPSGRLHHRRLLLLLLLLLCCCADPGHLRRPLERRLGPPERPPDQPLQEGHRLAEPLRLQVLVHVLHIPGRIKDHYQTIIPQLWDIFTCFVMSVADVADIIEKSPNVRVSGEG